jgi:hypothetical protein
LRYPDIHCANGINALLTAAYYQATTGIIFHFNGLKQMPDQLQPFHTEESP